MNKTLMLKIHKNIDALIQSDKLKNKTILIFGANKTADIMCLYLSFKNIPVTAIIDNSTEKWGSTICGVSVFPPEKILSGKNNENIIILIASKYYREMIRSVEKYGLKEINFAQTLIFTEYSVSKEAFQNAVNTIMEGFYVYSEIKEKYGGDTFIILNPTPSMGDSFFIFSYAKQYATSARMEKYVLAATGVAAVKISGMFSDILFEEITLEENNSLLSFASFAGADDVKIISYAVPPNSNVLTNFYGKGKLNWGVMIREIVMGLPENATKTPPKKKSVNTDTFFEENGLKKGKTVIIAPFAITAQTLPDTFWQTLCYTLFQKGYTVCVNEASCEYSRIKGAKPIFIPLEDVLQIAEEAGAFISIRSGICDLLSASNAKIISIYPNKEFLEFFGLINIGVADSDATNCIELVYQNDDETINEVIKTLED